MLRTISCTRAAATACQTRIADLGLRSVGEWSLPTYSAGRTIAPPQHFMATGVGQDQDRSRGTCAKQELGTLVLWSTDYAEHPAGVWRCLRRHLKDSVYDQSWNLESEAPVFPPDAGRRSAQRVD